MSKLKVKINENVDQIKRDIAQLLPQIETEWEKIENDDEKPYFTTQIGNIKFIVKEFEVDIVIIREDRDGKIEDKKTLSAQLSNNKQIPSRLYTLISKRFDEEDEIKFYKEIHESLSGLIDENVEETQPVNNDTPGKNKFLQDFT